jgi:hypothetical protein
MEQKVVSIDTKNVESGGVGRVGITREIAKFMRCFYFSSLETIEFKSISDVVS